MVNSYDMEERWKACRTKTIFLVLWEDSTKLLDTLDYRKNNDWEVISRNSYNMLGSEDI